MRALTAVLCFFYAFAVSDESEANRAWHRQERFTWAARTGLPAATIEHMWRAVMGRDADNFRGEGIETIDAFSLRSRKQILFIMAGGSGHCLTLYVFGNSGQDERPLWQSDGLHDYGSFCREDMMPYPAAYARPNGEIVVQIPTGPAWVRRAPLDYYPVSTALTACTFQWNGRTYGYAEGSELSHTSRTYESSEMHPA